MKKIFLLVLILFLFLPTSAETLKGGVEFDWLEIKQNERNELVEQYREIVLSKADELKFVDGKIEGKNKDKKSFETYGKIKSGLKEDNEKYMASFYFHDLLIAYGIVEKTNLKNAYYYDVMGNLRYVDFLEKEYGKYPYVAYQYDKKGNLISRVYNISKDDQFMYSPEGKFIGRWYLDKMYNRKGKVISKRRDY